MRTPREQSETDIYHVTTRGTGRQNIFEDDEDRHFFLKYLEKLVKKHNAKLLAWCLMDNHVHLLIKIPLPRLSTLMQQLKGRYAQRFNRRYGRIGHLFEGRFKSDPITEDAHLLAAVRYIHQNPVRAGLSSTCEYSWSSFSEYAGHAALTDTSLAIEISGGRQVLLDAHAVSTLSIDLSATPKPRISDEEARKIIERMTGSRISHRIASLTIRFRDIVLSTLRKTGISIRQLERLTGIGRGIIQRCSPRNSLRVDDDARPTRAQSANWIPDNKTQLIGAPDESYLAHNDYKHKNAATPPIHTPQLRKVYEGLLSRDCSEENVRDEAEYEVVGGSEAIEQTHSIYRAFT